MYAVIRDGSVQCRVAKGDVIEIERTGLEAGAEYNFDVLALNKDGKTTFGTPTVKGAKVVGEVMTVKNRAEGEDGRPTSVESTEKKGPKIVIQHFRRRKGYHRKLGHRQLRSVIRITDIQG